MHPPDWFFEAIHQPQTHFGVFAVQGTCLLVAYVVLYPAGVAITALLQIPKLYLRGHLRGEKGKEGKRWNGREKTLPAPK